MKLTNKTKLYILIGLCLILMGQTVNLRVRNLNNIRYCSQFSGSDVGAKIVACIGDLPSGGGTADARGIEGGTISTDFCTGLTKSVIVKLGAGTYSTSLSLNCTGTGNLTIEGIGPGSTVIQQTNGAAVNGTIILSNTGTGLRNLRNLTIKRASAGVLASDNAIVVGPVQNQVNIENIEILNMGEDGILNKGNSAQVNLIKSYIHLNAGYCVNASGSISPVQNFQINHNTCYNNNGGVKFASSFGNTITNNDIEGGSGTQPANPLLNLTGNNITLSGNTIGLVSTATALTAAVFNSQNLSSTGDVFTVSGTNQIAIQVGALARNNYIAAPQLSAPGGGAMGTTAVTISAGATDTNIQNPNFGNTFANRLVDNGTRTTFNSNTTDAKTNLFQNLLWGNGIGELATNGNILLNSATHGIANTAGAIFVRALAGNKINLQDTNGTSYLSVDTSNGQTSLNGTTTFITAGSGIPAMNCAVGSLFLRIDAGSASTTTYTCYPANTWNPITVP